MITRAKAGIRCPNPKYALAATAPPAVSTAPALSPIPTSARSALRNANWVAAMQSEFEALQRNNTWTLVDRPPGVRVITGKWVYKYKLRADGSLERYKARWVVRGDTQRPGIDFGETFTPVVKPATIRTVLTLVASKKWPAHQLDVSNAFLHGHLQEKVYCQQPVGFVDPERPDAVCLLNRSLYGLRQAPRAWFTSFTDFVKSIGFVQMRSDSSLFVLRGSSGAVIAYLLLYVDMVLDASSPALLRDIINKLKSAFAIKDMGPLAYFLGVDVHRTGDGFFLSQAQYVDDILGRAGMLNCKPVATPADTKPKQSISDGKPVSPIRRVVLPQHRRRPAVLDADKTGYCVCRPAALSPHAFSARHPRRHAEAGASLRQGYTVDWHPAPRDDLADSHGLLRRRLGRLPGHPALDFRLLHLPRRRPRLMVLQAANNGFPIKRRSRVSRRRQHRGRVLVAPLSPR